MNFLRIVIIFPLISCLSLNLSHENIQKKSLNYLIEHSQCKIVLEDKIYLFNGYYFPEIWEINNREETIKLLSEELINSEDAGIMGLFQLFTDCQKIDDIYVFKKSSNLVFCPSSHFYSFLVQTGFFLFKAEFTRNSFYVIEYLSKTNEGEMYNFVKMIFVKDQNTLEREIVGKYNWNKGDLVLDDDLTLRENDYIRKTLKEYREAEEVPWAKSDPAMEKINSLSKIEVDDSIYVILGTYPLTMREIHNYHYDSLLGGYIYDYDYYIYENFEYSLVPYNMEFDSRNNCIIIHAYKDFKERVVLYFSIEEKKFIQKLEMDSTGDE